MAQSESFEREFNGLVVETFHLILQTELAMIKALADVNLSMREIHLIEMINQRDGQLSISDAANFFQITLASVTIMVNKLIKKGFVTKAINPSDGRSVVLSLTNRGREIDAYHAKFHRDMVEGITRNLTSNEQKLCATVIRRVNHFFRRVLNAKNAGLKR